MVSGEAAVASEWPRAVDPLQVEVCMDAVHEHISPRHAPLAEMRCQNSAPQPTRRRCPSRRADFPDLRGAHTHAEIRRRSLAAGRQKNPYGLEESRALFVKALELVDAEMAGRTWAVGDTFTMADCSAAPALFYDNRFFGPFRDTHPHAIAYLDRLTARPSYARALQGAKPFMHLLPK